MLPARSGRENSGASKGSISQVSTKVGSGSSTGEGAACAYAGVVAAKGFATKVSSTLFKFDSMIYWQSVRISETAHLASESYTRTVPPSFPTPKNTSFECCARKPDPACRYFVCLKRSCFDCNSRPDRIAIALCPAQAKCDRIAKVLHSVVKNSQLRSIAILENELQPSVMIEIRESKRSAVLRKIQPNCTRNFGKRAIAVVREQHVSFVAAPGLSERINSLRAFHPCS